MFLSCQSKAAVFSALMYEYIFHLSISIFAMMFYNLCGIALFFKYGKHAWEYENN